MSDDYRLRADLQRIIANAGDSPHWNTASDRPEMPARYTRADIAAAVQRAIEVCAERAHDYCHARTVEGRALKYPAVFTTHTGQDMADLFRAILADRAALARIIDRGKG